MGFEMRRKFRGLWAGGKRKQDWRGEVKESTAGARRLRVRGTAAGADAGAIL
jgi:hypothetical protein